MHACYSRLLTQPYVGFQLTTGQHASVGLSFRQPNQFALDKHIILPLDLLFQTRTVTEDWERTLASYDDVTSQAACLLSHEISRAHDVLTRALATGFGAKALLC